MPLFSQPRRSILFKLGLVTLSFSTFVSAQAPAVNPIAAKPKPPAARPWLDMDYGPVLSASIESAYPSRNITQKGMAIRLNAKSGTYVLFDEDLLRYSLAWSGGPIDWNGVLYNGNHQVWPAAVGEFICGTNLSPGWARAGNFDDPRTHFKSTDYKKESKEWQDRPYGPLPHEQGQFRGLYMSGQQVVLSYTVGGTGVLDSPGVEQAGAMSVITRTLNIEKSASDLDLLVLDHPTQISRISPLENPNKQQPNSSAKNNLAIFGDLNPPAAIVVDATKPAFPAAGLVASWSFDEAEGQAIASDLRLSADLSAATRTPGRFRSALLAKGGEHGIVKNSGAVDLSKDFSIAGWIKTKQGGTIVSKTIAGKWVRGGKTLFVEGGVLTLDIGWVGAVRSSKAINNDQWHHVAVTYKAETGVVQLYVDGKADAAGSLKSVADPAESQLRFGLTSEDFPRAEGNRLNGAIDEVGLYNRVLSAAEVLKLAPGAPAVPEKAIAVAAVGDLNEMTWSIANKSSLRLHIPAAATPAKIKIFISRVDGKTLPAFTAALQSSLPRADLSTLTHGGPARYPQKLSTQGKLNTQKSASAVPYLTDQITAPNDNPFKSRLRFGAFDFFPDGKSAAISTWDGDVWLVSNIDEKLENITWQRIATGLYQPLGLKIIQSQIYVLCRDQIVRLHDLNGDGEIDFYECFNNDAMVTEHFHEFAMGLQTDPDGNFYYAKSARHGLAAVVPHHGTLLKVSKDGSKTEILANGFRAANGVGIGPDGELAATDQEGYYTPANRVNLILPSLGGHAVNTPFYGNLWSYLSAPRTIKDGYDPPLCWLPVNVDRSPAEDLWVTSDKWGPLKGSLIHTSYGTGKLLLVPYEIVDGVPQGGAVAFPDIAFRTGVMRARLNPVDGQLYLCGLVGWATDMTEPGGFYRVRYTGAPVQMPVGLHAKKDELAITFTNPLDKASAQDLGSYSIQQWNYRWTQNYGSKHYSVADPNKQGQDDVEIASASLSEDGKTVTLKIPSLQTVMQMKIQVNLKSADGTAIKQTIHNTINRL